VTIECGSRRLFQAISELQPSSSFKNISEIDNTWLVFNALFLVSNKNIFYFNLQSQKDRDLLYLLEKEFTTYLSNL
jgi:hypothetical protein